MAILGGASRKGAWHPEPVMNVVTFLGGAELDFREAVLPGKEVILRAVSVLGGIEVTVPPEMRVVDNGIAILGGREIAGNPGEAASPDAPVLRIEGTCVLGGIEVKRKSRKPPKGRGKGLNVSIESGGFPALRVRPGRPRRLAAPRQSVPDGGAECGPVRRCTGSASAAASWSTACSECPLTTASQYGQAAAMPPASGW